MSDVFLQTFWSYCELFTYTEEPVKRPQSLQVKPKNVCKSFLTTLHSLYWSVVGCLSTMCVLCVDCYSICLYAIVHLFHTICLRRIGSQSLLPALSRWCVVVRYQTSQAASRLCVSPCQADWNHQQNGNRQQDYKCNGDDNKHNMDWWECLWISRLWKYLIR